MFDNMTFGKVAMVGIQYLTSAFAKDLIRRDAGSLTKMMTVGHGTLDPTGDATITIASEFLAEEGDSVCASVSSGH